MNPFVAGESTEEAELVQVVGHALESGSSPGDATEREREKD